MGTVVIAVREVYGQARAYPVNETAKAFVTLIGQKTLTAEHLRLIKELGFKVEVQAAGLAALGL
jgi:hypothetical protein